jgi:hypothetical protein
MGKQDGRGVELVNLEREEFVLSLRMLEKRRARLIRSGTPFFIQDTSKGKGVGLL